MDLAAGVMTACHLALTTRGVVIAVPEIANFAVAANKDGLLEIVAIAGPTTDDQQFTGAVWLAQESINFFEAP